MSPIRLVAAALGLMAAVVLTLVTTASPADAEHVIVHPKAKAVRYVEVDRTPAALTMTAQAVNAPRKRLSLQEWGLDTYGGPSAELFVDWFVGDRAARVSLLHGGHLRQSCRRIPVEPLAHGTGARIPFPDRCLTTGPRDVRRVGVNHVTVMTVRHHGDTSCRVVQVPREGYLGPLGVGAGPDRGAYSPARPLVGAAKGC